MQTYGEQFDGTPASVGQARLAVGAWLKSTGCTPDCVANAVLLVSELATNAVVHARSSFTVAVVQADSSITVEVTDASPGEVDHREPDASGGHGLHIVASVADEWGVRPTGDGKAVFFRLRC
jgi:anti-sigma regulatory factor (Ser/Thr protein kinase)